MLTDLARPVVLRLSHLQFRCTSRGASTHPFALGARAEKYHGSLLRSCSGPKQRRNIMEVTAPFLKEHAHKSPSPKMAKDTKYARVLKTTLPPTKARKVVMLTPLRSVLQENTSQCRPNQVTFRGLMKKVADISRACFEIWLKPPQRSHCLC